MARYRAKSNLYVEGREIAAGQEFKTDLPPGSQWEPLDDDAHAAFASYVTDRRKDGIKVNEPVVPPATGPVEIPEKWRDLAQHQRINLARRLGAPAKGTGTAEADAVIEAEIAKRAEGQSHGE